MTQIVRMKVTLVVLQGFLLALVSADSLQNCDVEKREAHYNVYNAIVTDKAYYCSYSKQDDAKCVHVNGKLLNAVKDVPHKCTYSFFETIGKLLWFQRPWSKICELSIRTNLIEKTVKFSDNTMCLYNRRSCYMNTGKQVFWAEGDYCRKLVLAYSGTFTVWKYPQNPDTLIKYQDKTLILTKTFKFCGNEMWRTNFNDFIVLENSTRTNNNTSVAGRVPCENKTNPDHVTEQNVTNITTWYIYKYPTDVKVYVCLTNATCEDMEANETPPKHRAGLTNQCINFDETEAVMCEKILRLDLEKDMLEGLPPECKYSEGLCNPINASWSNTDRCSLIEKAYKGYESECENGGRCVVANDSTELMLFRQGKLCGEDVWYTPEIGLVASEKELLFSTTNFSTSKTEDEYPEDVDQFEFRQDEDIGTVQLLLYCVVFCAVFIILWCVFNVLVNFLSLRKLNKVRNLKDRVGLMNCLSNSLTARHLLLNREGEEKRDDSRSENFELYASVDNDLYNKS